MTDMTPMADPTEDLPPAAAPPAAPAPTFAPAAPASTFTPAAPAAATPTPPASALPPARRAGAAIATVIGLLAFLLLAAGEAYLWHRIQTIPAANTAAQIADLQNQISGLRAAAPAPEPLPASAPAPAALPVPTATADQTDRIATMDALLNALQTQTAADHAALLAMQADNAGLPKLTTQVTALQAQAAADHAQVTALQTSTAGLAKLTGQVTALSRLGAARLALDAGQPLGAIANAPPALAKFATAAPPTEAALVLAYPAAARRAEAASVAAGARGTYWSAVLARLENLVTISNGSHVIIGAPAAAVLNTAQSLLTAGDLAGAVTAIGTLSTTTQTAMGDWLAQARDLLAARAALATMAGQN